MNWGHVEAQWQQVKGKFKEKWGKLTDDDLEMISGKKDQAVAKLRERYADQRDAIETQLDAFIAGINEGKKNPKN